MIGFKFGEVLNSQTTLYSKEPNVFELPAHAIRLVVAAMTVKLKGQAKYIYKSVNMGAKSIHHYIQFTLIFSRKCK